jgi:ribose transport system substrate-binding protein
VADMTRKQRTLPWRVGIAVLAAAAAVAVAGCGSDGGDGQAAAGSGGSGDTKQMILAMPFPCDLNEGTAAMCAGAEAARKDLPPGYTLQIKTGVDYADTQAFNNLLQTTLQLNPAGLIVFPNGPAAQTPVLNQACDRDVKVIIMDSPATGVKCQSALVGADHRALGALVGKWLVEQPPASKEVGIVTQPPGQFASTDNRVKGFKEAVEAGGFKVVATTVTDLSLDKTRTQVTNMLTAHPNIGAIFSANGPMGQGTAQALKNKPNVTQVTLDFDSTNVAPIENGTLKAVGDQDPFGQGRLSVENLVKVIQGNQIPEKVATTLSVVDKENVQKRAAELKAQQ